MDLVSKVSQQSHVDRRRRPISSELRQDMHVHSICKSSVPPVLATLTHVVQGFRAFQGTRQVAQQGHLGLSFMDVDLGLDICIYESGDEVTRELSYAVRGPVIVRRFACMFHTDGLRNSFSAGLVWAADSQVLLARSQVFLG